MNENKKISANLLEKVSGGTSGWDNIPISDGICPTCQKPEEYDVEGLHGDGGRMIVICEVCGTRYQTNR
ncbi:MAG: hypothetical protein K6F86_12430 [Lachnospiraceae bacterium]|nr:hypothetical protein [Lachnospiraceae bacterium]